ncbi:MAG: DUF4214 domain-containing protein [Clostridia bacterium]|nr:DUF4214 domain-containing protein [Clostridia bacterium]
MNAKRSLLGLILAVIILLQCQLFLDNDLRADTNNPLNVQLADDGAITWDEVPDATYYFISFGDYRITLFYGINYNLFDRCESLHVPTGEYNYAFEAHKGSEVIGEISYGSFSYVNPNPQLNAPTGFSSNDYGISWVSNNGSYDTEFQVRVTAYSDDGNFYRTDFYTVQECFIPHSQYYKEGYIDYSFSVISRIKQGKGKLADSVPETYSFSFHNFFFKPITNIKIDGDGMMTWDPFPGADGYKISSFDTNQGVVAVNLETKVTDSKCDLVGFLTPYAVQKGVNYDITIYAYKGTETENYRISYPMQLSCNLNVYNVDNKFTSNNDPMLDSPQNLQWTNEGLTWDPVKCDSDEIVYYVRVLHSNNMGTWYGVTPVQTKDCNVSFEQIYNENYTYYRVCVYASAPGYHDSQDSIKTLKYINLNLSSIDNAKVDENCVLSWNSFSGATAYEVGLISDDAQYDIPSLFGETIIVNNCEIDLLEQLKTSEKIKTDLTKENGYHVYLTAMKSIDGNLYPISKKIRIDFMYPIPEKPVNPTVTTEPTVQPTNEPIKTPVTPTASPTTPTTIPTEEPSKGGGFEDFVERLYVVALNRPSEPEGKAFWCEHVGNGDLTGAACANEFLLSKEFNDRGLSDEEFLKVLYKTFFDRDAEKDLDGYNFWLNSLKTEGRDKVVDGFINSEEWCNICASYGVKSGATRAKATIPSANAMEFATRLYTCCLNRDPEEDGLKFWALSLTNLEVTGADTADLFFESEEFKGFNTSNEDYIKRLYTTFMGREYDDAGLTFWLSEMNNGLSRHDVLVGFANSKEFTEICASYGINRGDIS